MHIFPHPVGVAHQKFKVRIDLEPGQKPASPDKAVSIKHLRNSMNRIQFR
jgi:hypothetical protein